MIFPVRHIVAYLSHFMALRPGDVILTGTPQGVGMGQQPPVYLQRGDTVELSGGVLGTQVQRMV
jgi:2,4-diketo-3-deoxy-L-fuconate hydrolase